MKKTLLLIQQKCLKMTSAQLDQRIHEEYTVPVEAREVMKP